MPVVVNVDSLDVDLLDVNVTLNITHTYGGDLEVFLTHDGVTVELVTDVGQSDEFFSGTILDDDAVIDEGDIALLTGTIVDPGFLDSFTVDVNWGDGSSDSMAITLGASGFAGSVFADHVYADDGAYTITVQVQDTDTGITPSVNNPASV